MEPCRKMLIDALRKRIASSGCVEASWAKLDEGQDATIGVVSTARPFFVACRFNANPTPTLAIVPGEEAAAMFARSLAAYIGIDNVLLFPERADIPQLGQKADPAVVGKRFECAWMLKQRKKVVIVASARSLSLTMAPPSSKAYEPLVLRVGKELPQAEDEDALSAFRKRLVALGYQDTHAVEGPGTFASHGDVLDVYPASMTCPYRVDFFGDEIEDIRRIITSSGQTVSSVEELMLFPATDIPHTPAQKAHAISDLRKVSHSSKWAREALDALEGEVPLDNGSILLRQMYGSAASLPEYLGSKGLLCMVEPRAIVDDMSNFYQELVDSVSGSGIPMDACYVAPAAISFGEAPRATYVSILQAGYSIDDEIPIKRTNVAGDGSKLISKMRTWCQTGYACVFSALAYQVRKDYSLEFVEEGLSISDWVEGAAEDASALQNGVIAITDAEIPIGFVVPKAKLAMVSVEDTKGARGQASKRRRIDITQITFPYEPGDYVVHETYGIALFDGVVTRKFEDMERDYIQLSYAEGDKLYIPVEHFGMVTRYVGPQGSTPKVTRLNTADWQHAMRKARAATRKLAFDLIEVYSRRASSKGHRFRVDTPWLAQMEASFPYEETPDQAAAIADVKADMRSDRPMDRLICGDVGFGKTEVALRAAFIAAQDGMQVMVLCPTTILAQQSYISFKERFEPFGMRVEVLSRFRSEKQQQETLQAFEQGDVQVLIGTHRLLSRDVNPKELGLVIIDEEQRFGVSHKEQFKNMRESIDVLTLSATPIPRTMQMAVSGVRDMSLIMTPPEKRLPVKVHVGEWDPDVVSDAIRFELSRGGQVYYVSNRVHTIDDALARVRATAPEAKVAVAHGQMSKDELEHVMEDFSAGQIDVLVATTIIESGIDNPHTNTLVIEDSQRLGLAQMYQLKGRVGRSSVQAYAYFMFPEEVPLTEEAHARLEALSEHDELGSGMRIAMKDLEIRGAGSMLGAEQSGNLSAVGFDLFASMLNQAIADAREGKVGDDGDSNVAAGGAFASINLPGKMLLPEDYIQDVPERVYWYRRIADASTEEALADVRAQLEAQHPDMPPEASAYLDKEALRIKASERGITSISFAKGSLAIEGLALDDKGRNLVRSKGGRYLKEKRKAVFSSKTSKLDAGNAAAFAKGLLSELSDERQTQ